MFAGAHLYLATRGVDGMVPASARWRFVAAVVATLSLVGIGVVPTRVDHVFGCRPERPVFATAVAVAVGWFLYGVRARYLEAARRI